MGAMQFASSRCPNCGAQLQARPGAAQASCEYCGHTFVVQAQPGSPSPAQYRESSGGAHQSCPACAEVIVAGAKKCKHCGEWLERPAAHPLGPGMRPQRRGPPQHAMNFMGGPGQHPMMSHGIPPSKLVLAVLAFALPFGIHRFVMGYPGIGVLQFMTCWMGIGIFWCWADGLMILTGNVRMADGRPLT